MKELNKLFVANMHFIITSYSTIQATIVWLHVILI
jgi:hypothetical protein